MVVDQVNVGRVAVLKPEDNPPIRPYRDAPKSGQVPFKGVKLKAGDVHIFRLRTAFQLRQNTTHLFDMLGVDAPLVIIFVKSFKAAMSKAFYHASIVNRQVSLVKEFPSRAAQGAFWVMDKLRSIVCRGIVSGTDHEGDHAREAISGNCDGLVHRLDTLGDIGFGDVLTIIRAAPGARMTKSAPIGKKKDLPL